ncbi:MAG: hypothetical protein ACLSAP_00250 [Oscillospiraceae bacterium]
MYPRQRRGGKTAAAESDYDVIVSCPLPDEFGHELGCLADRSGAGVILLVKSDIADEVVPKWRTQAPWFPGRFQAVFFQA